MFVRVKHAGKYDYLQLVENRREGKQTRQRIVATLGRLDRLHAKGQVDVLLRSLGRFAERIQIQEAHKNGELEALSTRRIGPALVFGRLWKELGIDRILNDHLEGRKFQFDVERAVFAKVCFIADRGMVSNSVIGELEAWNVGYILGVRMRRAKEVGEKVLSHPGRYQEVEENLHVKEVNIDDRRYIVFYNPGQAKRDARDRESILEGIEKKRKQGTKALVGNRGFRRYLTAKKGAVRIDYERVKAEARYDGKWVLRTNTALPASEVALQYNHLLTVERFFRTAKSLLETRPIFHKTDLAITGHLFTSFLALVLVHELTERLKRKGWKLEWADILRDLEVLEEVGVRHQGKRYLLRTPLKGVCGKVLQGTGVAIPPPVSPVREKGDCGAKTSSRAL